MNKLLALVVAFVFASVPATAATYYVSLTGNDAVFCATAQNATTPKRTIASAVPCLAPGDTLLMRAGIYTGTSNVIDSARFKVPSGTAWTAAVTISGYPGETVTIQPPEGYSAVKLTTGAPHYLIFQDFIVDMMNTLATGPQPEGIYLSDGAHHNRFLRIRVKNAKRFGIVFSKNNGNSPFNEVRNSWVHNTGDAGGDPRNGHGLYISTSDNLFEGNEVYDNAGAGFHFYDDAGPKYVNRNIIRGNTIRNNGANGGGAYAVVMAWGGDNVLEKNTIVDNYGGVMIYTGSDRASVFHNVIARNKVEAVTLQYFSSAPTIRDNVIYGNGRTIVNSGGTGTPQIFGNVFYQVGAPGGVLPSAPVDVKVAAETIAFLQRVQADLVAELQRLQGQ